MARKRKTAAAVEQRNEAWEAVLQLMARSRDRSGLEDIDLTKENWVPSWRDEIYAERLELFLH